MKKLIFATAVLGLSTAAQATPNGFYLGGQFGYADTGVASQINHDFPAPEFPRAHSDNLGASILAGYQFSPYLAAELGYTRYSDVKFAGMTVTEQSADLVGKAIYPLENTGLSIYAKAGAAYVRVGVDNADGHENGYGDTTQPLIGAGVNYDINQNLSTNIDYTYINKDNSNDIPAINFVSLGLAYHFA